MLVPVRVEVGDVQKRVSDDVLNLPKFRSWRGCSDLPSKCGWITGSIGFMAVSAVDLQCVFGRILVMFDQVIPSFSSVFWTQDVLYIDSSTEEGSSAMLYSYIGLYTRLTCVHVEPAHQTPSTAPPLPWESHPAQRFSIRWYRQEQEKKKRGGIQQREKKKQMARMASRDASNMPRRYAGLGPSSARTASPMLYSTCLV